MDNPQWSTASGPKHPYLVGTARGLLKSKEKERGRLQELPENQHKETCTHIPWDGKGSQICAPCFYLRFSCLRYALTGRSESKMD